MTIIVQNQPVKAAICAGAECLEIDFADDACFTRSETVLVDLMQRSIGVIFQNSYHHIGDMPSGINIAEMEMFKNARLSGQGEGGREIVLHAPLKIVRAS